MRDEPAGEAVAVGGGAGGHQAPAGPGSAQAAPRGAGVQAGARGDIAGSARVPADGGETARVADGPRAGPPAAGWRAGQVRAGWRARWLAIRQGSPLWWYVIFAGFAAVVAAVSGGDDAIWGRWAAGGYALAAILARRARWVPAALAVASAGALAAPAAWLALRAPATADVSVVTRSAVLLLHHGSPYLPPGSLASWRDYDPYLPAMALFGMPWALGLHGLAGDTRIWLTAATAMAAVLAFRIAAQRRGGTAAGHRPAAVRLAALACSSPLLAFPLAVGITDPAMIALLCVGLACLARPDQAGPQVPLMSLEGPAGRWPVLRAWLPPAAAAGLAIGAASAMKATAWPAIPVLAAMLARRDGARAAVLFAVTSAATALPLIAATAPALAARPAALLRNTVLFPLGLTTQRTPAASPMPGHILASIGPAGHVAAIALVAAAGIGVAAWLVVRPPADVRAAVWRLAAGLTLLFALAPASRFGYLAYPAALLGWLGLSHRRPAAGHAASGPVMAGPPGG